MSSNAGDRCVSLNLFRLGSCYWCREHSLVEFCVWCCVRVAVGLSQEHVARGSAPPLRFSSSPQRSHSAGTSLMRVQSVLRASLTASFSTSAAPSAGALTAPAATSVAATDAVVSAEAAKALGRLEQEVAQCQAAVKKLETRIEKTQLEIVSVSAELAVPDLDSSEKMLLRADKKSLRDEETSLRAEKLLVSEMLREKQTKLDAARAAGT